jgi:hypothetical protein
MIDRAIELRLAIDSFTLKATSEWNRHKKKDQQPPSIVSDALTPDDWFHLEEYCEILKPIHNATAKLQGHAGGNFGSIWLVLPTFETLLGILEEKKHKCTAEVNSQAVLSQLEGSNDVDKDLFWNHLATAVNRGWQKLNEYYGHLDDTPVYVAAIVLHPFFKWVYCEKYWTLENDRHKWTEDAKKSVDRL